MSNHLTHKEALVVKFVIALAALVCVAAFAPFADASRTSLRFEAAQNREVATAPEGSTGGTGGTNGGSSGESGAANENPQDVNVNEELAQALLDELIASDPNPLDFASDEDLGDDAAAEVEDLEQEPEAVSFITLLHSIISRFRSK